VKPYGALSSFIVQIVKLKNETLITVQNIRTLETSTQLSWNDTLSVMQKACAAEEQKNCDKS